MSLEGRKQQNVRTEFTMMSFVTRNYLPNITGMIKSKRIKWSGHAARIGEKGNAYRVLAKETDGKRPYARPRRRLEDIIKINPKN
jgi:hypothetical protein